MLLNLADFEEAARDSLSPMAYDYYAGGSDDEVTVRRNRDAFEAISLAPRVLVGVSTVDTVSAVLGRQVSMPVLLAPTSAHKLAHPQGELATVAAAGRAGTVMVLSTLSTVAVEEVVTAASGPVWFQLYVYRDRGITVDLVARAEQAGCEALVVTVDAPWLGNRERDVRNSFHFPEGIRFENLHPAGWSALPKGEGTSGLASYFSDLIDPSLSWADLEWL
ncbi:MAG TPA: alpha-hydroxy acid oxidase, partial [Acidimicrobiia bacterium]